MRVGIAADHQGFDLKEQLIMALKKANFEVIDCGAFQFDPKDDYPNFVIPLAERVSRGDFGKGIAICGSGVGASIASNKIPGARAGLIHDVFSARQGVEDDDMNIICLGAQLTEFCLAWDLVQTFLGASFTHEPRFERRLNEISRIEQMGFENET